MENRNRLKNMILQPGVFAWLPALAFLIIFISHSVGFGASNQSIVYQGRIQRPDGSVPNTGSITFSVAVYSPAPKKCLLYSETQSVSMAGSGGMFSLALGMGSRNDSGSQTFDQIFVNGGSLSGLNCADGSTSYAPAATDDRNIIASFNDNGTVVNLSAMEIKSIPFALQAHQIGGYGINDIIKVHPNTGSATTFTTAEMVRVRALGGANCASNEILKWNGMTWICSADNTGGSPGDASFSAKGLVQFDTNAATSGIAVAAGVAKLSDILAAPGSFGTTSKAVSVTVNAHGRITAISEANIALPAGQISQSGATTGQVLKWDGTAWAPDNDLGTTTDASYAGKGLVRFDTDQSTSGIDVASGVAKVNTGTGANQIVKLDATGKLPALDASALTGITATGYSGLLPVANGGTNSSTALNNNRLMVSSGGKIVEASAMTNGQIVVGSTSAAPVVATLGNSNGITITPGAGSLSIGTNATDANTASTIVSRDASGNFAAGAVTNTSNILKGSTSGTLTMTVPGTVTPYTLTWPSGVGSAGSFLTTDASGNLSWGSPAAVADASYAAKGAVQGLTDAATSGLNLASGVISVNAGTSANQIVKLDASAKLPAVDGSALTNLSAANIAAGTLPVSRGGTGATTLTSDGVLLGNGTSAVSATAAGTANQVLRVPSGGGAPAFGAIDISQSAAITGTLPPGSGGTGQSSYAAGDMLYATGATATSKLSIGASGTILTSTGAAPQWSTTDSLGFFKDGGNTFTATATLGANSNHNLEIETNGTTKMTIESGGDVGIGLTNPVGDLHVHRASGTGFTEAYFTNTTTNATATDGLAVGIANSNGDAYIWNYENTILQFGTNNQERMRINASGEVGIGTTATAGTKLEILGSGATSPLMKLVRSSGQASQTLDIHPGDSTNNHHYITANTSESNKKKLILSSVHNSGGFTSGNLGFTFRIGPSSAPVEVLNILESGYAGIGNITPTSILDIDGAFTQRGMAAPSNAPAGQGRIYFDSTSNKFRISQNGGAYLDLVPGATADASYSAKGLVQGLTDAATSGLVFSSGVISVNVGTGANQIVKIDGSGKLPALDGSALTNLDAAQLAGALPALDGSALTSLNANNIASGVLPIARGGTGLTTGTSGGIPYFSAASTMASSAALPANGVVLGGGAGAAPTATAAGSAHSVLRVPSGGGAPVFGAIELSQSAAVNGSLGIGNGGTGASSFAANRLIGTNGTGTAQQVVTCSPNHVLSFDSSGNYGCYTVSSLTEKSVTFTPSTVGWYRILNGSNAMNLGGMIRIAADQYDNRITDVELQFNIGGYSTSGSIQQTRFASYNYGVVDRARVSSDGAGSVYLDIYISSATAPGPVTVFAFGPRVGTLVAAPVVGAVAGSTDVKVLNLGHGFRTTHGVQVGDDSGACDAAAAGTFRYTTDNAMEFCNGSNWKIVFVNGGSTYTGAAVLGTNSNHNLEFETNGSTRMTIDNTGKVGIGVAGPTAKLEVQGQIVSKENIITSGATADFATGNTQILQSVGGSTITLDNMVNGGQYTVIVEDATARTYSFGNCTTTRAVPALATTTGRSVFTILKTSTACYITWITGF